MNGCNTVILYVCQLIIFSGFELFSIIDKTITLSLLLSSTACFLLFTFPQFSFALVVFFFVFFAFSDPPAMKKPFNILSFSTLHNPRFHLCPFLFLSLPPFPSSLTHSVASHLSYFSHSCRLTLSLTHDHSSSTLPEAIYIRSSCHLSQRVGFIFFNGNIFQMGKCSQPSNIPEVFAHHYTA